MEQRVQSATRWDTTLFANLITDVNATFHFDPDNLSQKNQARIFDTLNQLAKVHISIKYFLHDFPLQLDEAIEGWQQLQRIADTRPAKNVRYLSLPR